MDFQMEGCPLPKGVKKDDSSEERKTSDFASLYEISIEADTILSDRSFSSQKSALFSQNSVNSRHSSSTISQISLQFQVSLESDISIQSPASPLSQLSLFRQSSSRSELSQGFLPPSENIGFDRRINGRYVCRCISTVKGNRGDVSSIALSGERIYTGFSSNEIKVWLQAGFVEHYRFGTGDGAVKAIVVLGEKVFSAHQDHKIRVWKRSTQSPVHKALVTMPTAKDYLMTFISPKKHVQVRRHKKCLCIEHVDTISALAIGTNGVLYSGSWDRTVKVWRLSDFKCIESFQAHEDAINALVLSANGFLYTGSADGKVKVWLQSAGTKKHHLVTTLETHKKSVVNALALKANGSILYSGASDRSIVVWEREDSSQHMILAGTIRGHRHAILCLATVSNILCSGSADQTIRVWKRESGSVHSCLAVLKGHSSPVKCIAASLDTLLGYTIYSGSLDHDIKVWYIDRCKNDQSFLRANPVQRSTLPNGEFN